MTQEQVRRRIKGLPRNTQKSVICSLVGHSRIHTSCFGYKYCARCDAQVGDSLAGAYDGSNTVLVEHNCPTCRANFKKMDWRDKWMTPNPFTRPA